MLEPLNHERLQLISAKVHDEVERYEQVVGQFPEKFAVHSAKQAIKAFIPRLTDLYGSRVTVDASNAIVVEDDTFEGGKPLEGLHVQGKLTHLAIRQINRDLLGDGSIQLSSFDLFTVLTPLFTDPDPKDIIFGKKIFVPFGKIDSFEEAA